MNFPEQLLPICFVRLINAVKSENARKVSLQLGIQQRATTYVKNIDVHYLFSRVKMSREFAERFKDEVITVSCDDMNKLNVSGGMMVSGYHQINRIFMTDDTPDYGEHDFNLPGYKVCVGGYMSLEFNSKDRNKDF